MELTIDGSGKLFSKEPHLPQAVLKSALPSTASEAQRLMAKPLAPEAHGTQWQGSPSLHVLRRFLPFHWRGGAAGVEVLTPNLGWGMRE